MRSMLRTGKRSFAESPRSNRRWAAIVLVLACGCRGAGESQRPAELEDAHVRAPETDRAVEAASDPVPVEGLPSNEPEGLPPNEPEDGVAEADLRHAFPSREALARYILDALHERDQEALESVLVSEEEYRDVLWPEFVTKLPRTTLNPQLAFRLLDASSQKALHAALKDFGGLDLELLEVVPAPGEDVYETVRLQKSVVLRTRRRGDDETIELRIFGSFVERQGSWKLLSFQD